LERNPRFYDVGRVRIEQVIVRPTQDYPAALTSYRAGELDIDVNVPSQAIGWVKRNLPDEIHVAPYMQTFYVLFNVHAPQIRDIRVRTALSLAIDRETIAGRVMNAGEMPAYSLVPPHMPNYPGTAGLRFRTLAMPERRDHARKLLADAGYGPSNRLALDFNINNPTTIRLVAVALQSMWKEIGVDVRIVLSDEKDHYNLLLKQEYSVAWGGWTADYLDAENFLMLGESSAPELNNSGYSNPRFDALIAGSDRIADPGARGTCLAEAEQMLLDDGAIAPVYFGVARTLVSPAVKGWIDNDVNVHRIRWLSLDRRRAGV
jgi:oligopeptide transport system substrate-binding protein